MLALKGGRYITHLKRLRDVEIPLANFFASGVLCLGVKLGPVLWQLPETVPFDPALVRSFFSALPRTTHAAALLAKNHDDKLKAPAVVTASHAGPVASHAGPVRHALEPRHPSLDCDEARRLCAEFGVAVVIADSAGRWPTFPDATGDFRYVRLHGERELYTSGYTDQALDRWATRCRDWLAEGHDVHVYFDNDARGAAPHDAVRLLRRVS